MKFFNNDIKSALGAWRLWLTWGWVDIRQRYRRSRLGSLWLTLSLGITICGMSFVFGGLFSQDIKTIMHYIAAGMIGWSLITGMVTEGCLIFINADRVINGGVNGYSSLETLISFQLRALDLEPDLILVYLGINDAHLRLVWPPERYTADNAACRAPLDETFMPNILEYSTILRMRMVSLGWIKPHSSFERTVFANPTKACGFEIFLNQKRSGKYPRAMFREKSAMEMLKLNPPTYFKRNIESLVAIAAQQKVKSVLMTFAYSERFDTFPIVASEEYKFAYGETDGILKEIVRQTDAHLFDLGGLFPKDKRYFADGRHMTIRGIGLKARMIADYLVRNGLIQKPAAK